MAEPAAVSPKDGAHQPVTALQVKATELCHTYFTALGHLQNAAPEAPLDETGPARTARVAGFQGLVDELAAAVVQKHREIEGLVDELEAMPRSEEDELRRLREAQEDHAAATERLRASVAKTGAPHHAHLREKIDGPASHPRARAPPPHRVCWAATNLTLARTSYVPLINPNQRGWPAACAAR